MRQKINKEIIDKLINNYDKGKSIKMISRELSVSEPTIKKYLLKNNVIIRNNSESKKMMFKKGFLKPNISVNLIKKLKSRKGDKNPNWKGNDVGYAALHGWIKNNKKKPDCCEKCNKKTKSLDLANISGKYRRDINDFEWLCRKCHMNLDGRINNLKQYRGKNDYRNVLSMS